MLKLNYSVLLWCVVLVYSLPGLMPAQPQVVYKNPVVFQRHPVDEQGRMTNRSTKIWIKESDGSAPYQVTDGLLYDDHPSLYSDTRHVLYARYDSPDEDSDAGAKLIKHNIYTGREEVIAEEAGSALHHAALSHDDRIIVHIRDQGKRRSQIVRSAGSTPWEIPLQATNGVAVGKRVIFMHEKNLGLQKREVSIVAITGRGSRAVMRSLTDDRVLHRRPAVSPDGRLIAWQTNASGPEDEIFLMNIDGSGHRNLTRAPGNDGHPWFSRDGQWIVFESDRSGAMEIWKINIDTGETIQLTDGEGKIMSTRPRM